MKLLETVFKQVTIPIPTTVKTTTFGEALIDMEMLQPLVDSIDPNQRFVCGYDSIDEYRDMTDGPIAYTTIDPKWVVGKWDNFVIPDDGSAPTIDVFVASPKFDFMVEESSGYEVRIRAIGAFTKKDDATVFEPNKVVGFDLVKIARVERTN